jgi:hypothetical protein
MDHNALVPLAMFFVVIATVLVKDTDKYGSTPTGYIIYPPLPPPATGCCHRCIHAPPVPPLLSIALQDPEEINQGVNCWDQEC